MNKTMIDILYSINGSSSWIRLKTKDGKDKLVRNKAFSMHSGKRELQALRELQQSGIIAIIKTDAVMSYAVPKNERDYIVRDCPEAFPQYINRRLEIEDEYYTDE